jgi:hypothetical protein
MARQDHYWLRTSDYRRVFTDQKGAYSLNWEPGYIGVEFNEGESPEIDKEKWAQEISEKLSIECRWIFQPKKTAGVT